MLHCDIYLTPASLDEAFEAMAEHHGRYRIIAGATDLLPWAREGRAGDVSIPVLIDITRIPEMTEKRVDASRVRLGAATPIQRFLDDSSLGHALPAMPRCAIWFADDQIRESATVGGNIVNASPAGDCIPPLIAHEAEVELASKRNGKIVRRKMKLAEFLLGPSRTAMEDGELLTAFECDALPGYGGSFEKVGHRRSLVISVACVSTLVKLDARGRQFEDVRVAIAGVGPVSQRLHDVEEFLRAAPIDAERLEQAADMPVDRVQSRTRQVYRREVLRGFMMRSLINAMRRAGAGPEILAPELEASYV